MSRLNRASPPVTAMLAVGAPRNGSRPRMLQKRMNRNTDHRNGTYLSASCSPRLGRAISLRTKVRSDSKAFHHLPFGREPSRALRARGMKMARIRAAATSSSSMNLVIWNLWSVPGIGMAGSSHSTAFWKVVVKNSQTLLSLTCSIGSGLCPCSAMPLTLPALGAVDRGPRTPDRRPRFRFHGPTGQHQCDLESQRAQVADDHPDPEGHLSAEGVDGLRQGESAQQDGGHADAGGAEGHDEDVFRLALPGELGPEERGDGRKQAEQQGGAGEEEGQVAAAEPAGRQADEQPEGGDTAQQRQEALRHGGPCGEGGGPGRSSLPSSCTR